MKRILTLTDSHRGLSLRFRRSLKLSTLRLTHFVTAAEWDAPPIPCSSQVGPPHQLVADRLAGRKASDPGDLVIAFGASETGIAEQQDRFSGLEPVATWPRAPVP